MDQGEGRDVREGLGQAEIGVRQRGGTVQQEVDRTDDVMVDAERQRVCGTVAAPLRQRGPLRPAADVRTQVGRVDAAAVAEGVQARTLVGVHLEQLHQGGGVVGDGHGAQAHHTARTD